MHIAQREFSDEILERITQAVRDGKDLTRYALAKLVCGWVGWVDAAGRAKESSCRALLVKLERRGLIELPAARPVNFAPAESAEPVASMQWPHVKGNYDAASVAAACQEIEAAKLECRLMVDCSHANCSKQYQRQLDVVRDIAAQMRTGSRCIFGVMVESLLQEGSQKFSPGKDDPARLDHGRSITDGCLGWDDSLQVLEVLSKAVRAQR